MNGSPPKANSDPLRVVIAGGGIAALEALLALRARARGLVDVTLVADTDSFAYRALQVVESFEPGPARSYPLPAIVEDVGAHFVRGSVVAVDADGQRVVLDDGRAVEFDALLLALGARRRPAFDFGETFSAQTVAAILQTVESKSDRSVTFVVPEEVAWSLPVYELALLAAAKGGAQDIAVSVVTHEGGPLEIFGPGASDVVASVLEQAGVKILTGVAADVPEDGIVRAGSRSVSSAHVVSLPINMATRLTGVPCDESGYLLCDQHGRLRGKSNIWAAGDCTAYPIKQGGLASQQAEAAAADISQQAGAATLPRPFRPVLRGLLRTQNGPLYLRRAFHSVDATLTVSRDPLWWPPSKVAARRLATYLQGRGIDPTVLRRLPTGGLALASH